MGCCQQPALQIWVPGHVEEPSLGRSLGHRPCSGRYFLIGNAGGMFCSAVENRPEVESECFIASACLPAPCKASWELERWKGRRPSSLNTADKRQSCLKKRVVLAPKNKNKIAIDWLFSQDISNKLPEEHFGQRNREKWNCFQNRLSLACERVMWSVCQH